MAAHPLNVADYEALARERMDRGAFDYYAGGSGDERTLAMNVSGFDRYVLRPRVLVDVSRVDTSATVLGERLTMPILVAPTALQRLAHPDGECGTARAAAGTNHVRQHGVEHGHRGGGSGRNRAQVVSALRVQGSRRHRAMVERAESAGYRALVVTVDTPRLGRRERDERNASRFRGHRPRQPRGDPPAGRRP